MPVADGEADNDLPAGASLHTTTAVRGDTLMFSSNVTMQGNTVGVQNGRLYLAPGKKTLTREGEFQPMASMSRDSIRVVLVYDLAGPR